MKAIKKVIVWVVISLTMQMAVLYYVDNYLFAAQNTNNMVSKKVINEKNKVKKKLDIPIPQDAKFIEISYNGQYVSYYKDNVLKVVDVYTGKENQIQIQENHKISFYKWAPDRDILLLAMNDDSKENNEYVFCSYDAEKNKKDFLQNKGGREIKLATEKNDEIQDIQLTPLTNMIYIKTALKDEKSVIYSIDIMKIMEKVRTEDSFVGDMKVIPSDDRIVYESQKQGKVYITGSSDDISISEIDKLCVLSVDEEDRIYVGELDKTETDDFKVKNIYSGRAEQDTTEWKKTTLANSVSKKNIFILTSGKIYIKDEAQKVIVDISSNKKTSYKGKFLKLYEEGIAYIEDGKLIESDFK